MQIQGRNHQKGQVLLIVVLTMVVALTVGLSVASRIVTELRISSQSEESQRAFQAAEAGIQQTLRQNSGVSDTALDNSARFSSSVDAISNRTSLFINDGIEVDQDTGADVWLSQYNADPTLNFGAPRMTGNARIYWGRTDQDECNPIPGTNDPDTVPAIEVIVLQEPGGTLGIQKFVYDANGCGRIPGAIAADVGPFTVTDGSRTETYRYSSPVGSPINFNTGLVMKVIPIFNSTDIGLESGTPFPNQGKIITSTGESGDTTRRIKYYTSLPQLPIEVFPYSILSQ